MNLVVIAIGLSKIIIAAAMLVRPAQFTDRMQGYAGMTSLYVFELAMRFTLGAVLILIASDSRFPILLQIIGGISIAAGAILVVPIDSGITFGWVRLCHSYSGDS